MIPTLSDERRKAPGEPWHPPFHPGPSAGGTVAPETVAHEPPAGVAIPVTDADFTADLEVDFVPVLDLLPEAA